MRIKLIISIMFKLWYLYYDKTLSLKYLFSC